jgi:cell division protein FtsL
MARLMHKKVLPLVLMGFVVTLVLCYPLIAVWKQVYITNASIKQEALADSLAVLKRQTARMKMEVEKLSSPGRIEKIGLEALGLEYPPAENIVILRSGKAHDRPAAEWRLLTVLRRSFLNGKQG